jgi:hypothetical protein
MTLCLNLAAWALRLIGWIGFVGYIGWIEDWPG